MPVWSLNNPMRVVATLLAAGHDRLVHQVVAEHGRMAGTDPSIRLPERRLDLPGPSNGEALARQARIRASAAVVEVDRPVETSHGDRQVKAVIGEVLAAQTGHGSGRTRGGLLR